MTDMLENIQISAYFQFQYNLLNLNFLRIGFHTFSHEFYSYAINKISLFMYENYDFYFIASKSLVNMINTERMIRSISKSKGKWSKTYNYHFENIDDMYTFIEEIYILKHHFFISKITNKVSIHAQITFEENIFAKCPKEAHFQPVA